MRRERRRPRRFIRRQASRSAQSGAIAPQPLNALAAASRQRPLNVLISAYSCEPGHGSERGQGWNWSEQAACSHRVTVLTVSRGRASIERAVSKPGSPNLAFRYLDVPLWPKRWSDRDTLIRLHYVIWQFIALPVVWRLHRQRQFDLMHHVTFNVVDLPGFLWLLPAPFVWGPVGGGQRPSDALKAYFGRRWYLEQLRILRKRIIPYNPLVRVAVRRAAAILYVNADTGAILRRLGARDLTPAIDAGVKRPTCPVSRCDQRERPTLRIAWAGVLTRRKAPDLALDLAVLLKQHSVPFTLRIAGNGPLMSRLAARINSLGLDNDVTLLGELSHVSMSDFFANSDVFLFTSLHDTSGNVLLEAMAAGLPIVCLNQHGAAEIVTDDCGIKVGIVSREQVLADLTRAVERLAREPELRIRLGEAGYRRVRDALSWDHKGALVLDIYRKAVGDTR